MPKTKTPEEWAETTTNARRQARYLAAEARIRRIVDAAPPFTDEQIDKLVTLLRAS